MEYALYCHNREGMVYFNTREDAERYAKVILRSEEDVSGCLKEGDVTEQGFISIYKLLSESKVISEDASCDEPVFDVDMVNVNEEGK